MKSLLVFVICLFCNIHVAGQLTSDNVLEYYERSQSQPAAEGYSRDIIIQIGANNYIEVIDNAPEYLGLSQIGNNNSTLYINPGNYPTNAEINVQGTGNHVEVLGTNSISDGMIININANDMTMYMKNY